MKRKSVHSGFFQSLGPGLVWAAAAVGVSHLVQSTRAGASYGFVMAGVILLALLLKYPFFEFGPRYAAATGESLVGGYARQGRWAVWVYLLLTLSTMFTVVGAVTFVTGSLATQLFGPVLSPFGYSAIFMVLCALLLMKGRYALLDRLVKIIIVVLTLSTIAAVIAALAAVKPPQVSTVIPPELLGAAGFAFLIALVGWMPSAVDVSVWHSLWTLERARQTGHQPSLRESLLDFNIGYFGTALLALLFLSLGALVIYGTGVEIATSGTAFAAQLISTYTAALGPWSHWIIAVAAFTTMFSTTLTCVDAFPRALAQATATLGGNKWEKNTSALYWLWMLVLLMGSLLLISIFRGYLTHMVDLATTLSFLTSPVLGYLNYRAVTASHMPAGTTPPRWLRLLSWVGLGSGVVFSIIFLVWRFG